MFLELARSLPWLAAPAASDLERHWWSEFPASAVASEGLGEVLDSLVKQGLHLGIVSNGGSSAQNAKIDVLGLRPYMKAILISEEAGIAKPSPEIFLRALELVGAEPSEALFVGDDPVADILGALGAGLQAAWLRRGRKWGESTRPTLEIDSLSEILTLV